METSATPVCVPYDTQLVLEDIPRHVQDDLRIGPREAVTFVRIEQGPYHDGVRFMSGREVTLQRLGPGTKATVTMLLQNAAYHLRAAAMT